ncbi:MAG: peptidoglycan-binding protein LysM [Firmicutes bacterium]|nr:peptidoglycan-binding protein LysM [Bacillota bacterium]
MVEKAKIKVLDGPNKGEITVMFNPKEYATTLKVVESGQSPNIQFKKVAMENFKVPLFFDTYEKQTDVRDVIKPIVSLVNPIVEGTQTKKPPLCLFVWGGFSFEGYAVEVRQNFTMFLESGIPVRCDLDVTFRRNVPREQAEIDAGLNACRKLWTVKSGDRLDLIAAQALKDPAQWRRIAKANSIINPLAFPTDADIGKFLVIPDFEGHD